MKIEVEVTEEEMKSAIERHIRNAVADRVNSWGMQEKVKKMINESWDIVAQQLIIDCLKEHPKLEKQISEEIEKKIRRQLNASISKYAK